MRANLEALYGLADSVDRREGALAYARYHALLSDIAAAYGSSLPAVTAVFAATSPNNDYYGNLRSTVSILEGVRDGRPFDDITISTYRHCGERAYSYARRPERFLAEVRGLKIKSFYLNLIDPTDEQPVTIDGHMVGAYLGSAGSMKDLIVRPSTYKVIAQAVREIAADLSLIPHQLQATLWFARKRTLKVRYDAQLDLFHGSNDQWRTLRSLRDIRPYPPRVAV